MPKNPNTQNQTIGIAFIFLCMFTMSNHIALPYYFPWIFGRLPFVLGVTALFIHIFGSITKGRTPFEANMPLFCLLILFSMGFMLSRITTVNPERSQECMFTYTKTVIVFFLISVTVRSMKELKGYLIILASGAFFIAYQMTHYAYYKERRPFIRGSTLASDPNDTAMVMVYSLPIVAILLYTFKNKALRLYFFYALAMMALCLIATQSRGGFLATVVMIAAFIREASGFKKKLKTTAIVIALLIPFTILFVPKSFIWRMFEISDTERDSTGSADERKKNMTYALEYMLTHPISSYGPGNNGYMCADKDGKASYGNSVLHGGHVHCSYLEIGADIGLIGFILFMLFHFFLFRSLRKSEKLFKPIDEESRHLLLYIKTMRVSLSGYMIASFFLPVSYRFYLYFIGGVCVALHNVALNYRYTLSEK